MLRWRNVEIVPVLHGRLECALAVRDALARVDPDAVAVELPATIEAAVRRAVARLPFLSVVSYDEADGKPAYLVVEPTEPVIEALRWAHELGRAAHFVDRDTEGYAAHDEAWPHPYAARRIGYDAFIGPCVDAAPPPSDHDRAREATMAHHVQAIAARHERVALVVGAAHARRVAELADTPQPRPLGRTKREGVLVHHLAADSAREVMAEMPYLCAAYEAARAAPGADAWSATDRYDVASRLLRAARDRHRAERDEHLGPAALATALRFARNFALLEGALAPDLYHLVVGARGVADDNFAWQTWDLATLWPHEPARLDLPSLRLTLEDLARRGRLLRLRRTRVLARRVLRLVKERARERRPGEWRDAWRGAFTCSYPPEDVAVEGFGATLKKRALAVLSEEAARTEPFTTSLLDGLDMRETIRNWHVDGRPYVRERRPARGRVGSVVVVFDEDAGAKERFPFTMTWQGEHEQESDMALYSTPSGADMAGPGISRCTYGGFCLTYPPGRMFGVFEDPAYEFCRGKPERLLAAAIDHCEERMIVYVAARPPAERLRVYAAHRGRRVVYVPLGELSPVRIRKLRTFHVLDGHGVRRWAPGFIT